MGKMETKSKYAQYDIKLDKLRQISKSSDGLFSIQNKSADFVATTFDNKIELVGLNKKILAYVKSELGFSCYYPIEPVKIPEHIDAVMMDLDGTTVRSEQFWIRIIEQTTSRLINNTEFKLSDEDLPYVSGHSVSEHLQYCIDKYCPEKELPEARRIYFEITQFEMNEIMSGRGYENAFIPNEGVKDFINFLKENDIKIGLVTSGLYEKAYPEILSAFNSMRISEKPEDYYNSIITAGFRLQQGSIGTLGELEPKPHPWLYAETFNVGLGIPYEKRNTVIGIEDSAAGVYSIRLSNVYTVGIDGGNIKQSGAEPFCNLFSKSFDEIKTFITKVNKL